MTLKKSQNKDPKTSKKTSKTSNKVIDKLSEEDDDSLLNSDIIGDKVIDDMLNNESLGELDVEDDEEFIHQVEEFKKEHSKSKLAKVYEYIGSPKFIELKKLSKNDIKDELRKLIVALDKKNIIVHSHGDPDDREKYRFITEEIFNEDIEVKKNQNITFVYEDYHPEMDDSEDDEEFF